METAVNLHKINYQHWRKLAAAFYGLAHNSQSDWDHLEGTLKETDVGLLCQKYLDSCDYACIEKAGRLLAGENWFAALGRSL